MTTDNDLNVKPLTNLHYVAPTNKSDQQPDRSKQRYKRKPADQKTEDNNDDNGTDTLHVIDYCA
jgi:hypothetical protein